MKYPLSTDYQTAVKYCKRFVLDPVLVNSMPQQNKYGLVMYSGGYTRVFPMTVGLEKYALRCWIADVYEAEYRYKSIKKYLNACKINYFVSFDYVKKGILVNGIIYPVLRMEWAEGLDLKEFIRKHLTQADILKQTAKTFLHMTKELHAHKIAHGDLQHENIMVQKKGNHIQLVLIDYDSLYIPDFIDMPDHIVGLPAFQHPTRIGKAKQALASEKMDYFSELIIYISLMAFAERPDCWDIFNLEISEGLIFNEKDFECPEQSKAFSLLKQLSHPIRVGVDLLKSYCKQTDISLFIPIEQVIYGADDSLTKMFDKFEAFSKSVPPPKRHHVPKVKNDNINQLIQNIKQYSPPEKAKQPKQEYGVDQLINNIQYV